MKASLEKSSGSGSVPAHFFALRTPLLPFEVFADWSRDCVVRSAKDDDELHQRIEAARREIVARLKALIDRADVLEALYLASPGIVEDIVKWREPGVSNEKVERAVTRYFQRMCGRSTPFGAFSGCSVGDIRPGETQLRLPPLAGYRRYTRLDNLYTFHLARTLARRADIKVRLRYMRNSTLFRIADRWQLVAGIHSTGAVSYELVAVDGDDALDGLLAYCDEPRTIDEMARFLADASDPPPTSEIHDYLGSLIEWQVLIDDLTPPLTGGEPLAALAGRLSGIAEAAEDASAIEGIESAIGEIDRQGLGATLAAYRAVEDRLRTLDPEIIPTRCFQVNLVKPALLVLGTEIADLIEDGVALLHRIGEPSPPDPLRQFKDAFVARYEQREVPLLEVLNPEVGVGFDRGSAPSPQDEPLLMGLVLPVVDEPFQTQWTGREHFVLGQLHRIWRDGHHVWELSDTDIEGLTRPANQPFPSSFAVLATIGKAAGAAGEASVFMKQIHGPSGANFLGRFCHADPVLHEHVLRHLREEESERPDAIFAEIVHLPEGRLANILSRPLLRGFEIPFLARSGAPSDRQIAVADLLVSVTGDRVRLRSSRLGREVVPRLSTMHNFRTGQRVYDFLATVQNQGSLRWLRWEWGVFQSAPFLPRVTRGRLVLARAKWTLSAQQLNALGKGSNSKRVAAAQRLRSELRLPRFAVLVDADQEMPVDFDNVLSAETLVHMLAGRNSAALAEMWGVDEGLCVRSDEGTFVNEVVVPMVSTPMARDRGLPVRVSSIDTRERLIPPLAQWTYLNLFAGPASIDHVLTGCVAELLDRLREMAALKEWFFVRYSEPSWHLRLRFFTPDGVSHVMPEIQQAMQKLLTVGLVHRAQIDTYHREIERYGGPEALALVEQLFHHDSEAMLAVLVAHSDRADRWRACLRSWNALLDDFGLSLEQKHQCVSAQAEGMKALLKFDKPSRLALARKFRAERSTLEDMALNSSASAADDVAQLLLRRSEHVRAIVRDLRALSARGQLTSTVEQLVPSLLHMNANRLLRSGHRWQETAFYDFLERLYESRLARNGGNRQSIVTSQSGS